MPNKTEILNELKLISPVVASITPGGPLYEAPPGYFEQFPAKILDIVQSFRYTSTLLNSIGNQNLYAVPQGYFESFADNMLSRIKAGDAKSSSEELAILSPLLSGIGKKSPFSVPAGYFSELSENAVAGVQAVDFANEELENLSPLMSGLKNLNVYEAPTGYFDNLPAHILANAKAQTQLAKVISIGKRKSWLKYAAAAIVIGLVATGGFLFLNNHAPTATDVITADLAKLSDQDIVNYMDTHNTIDTDSLSTIAAVDINDNDAKDLLGDISDAELQQYADNDIPTKDLITN